MARGQVDAPIELVIAIIILVMSMGLAFFVINSTNEGKCINELKSQTQQLQQAILDVGLGSTGTQKTVRFYMPRCGDKTVEAVQFVKFTSPQFCKRCPGAYNGCWQIIPLARTADGLVQLNDAVVCVDLPAQRVSINPDAGQNCAALTNHACPQGLSGCSDRQLGLSSGALQNSVWQTLGRGDDGARHYLITLRKDVSSSGLGFENAEIKVCAEPVA
ncbi:hypothetical protein HY572_02195 [Candidatus Micrarchaeota archaeon]|nr:hypothetical protein [Candidatus Micrarchaeota archaeon]